MEIGQLEAFINVVQYKSFSRAAEAMGLTQPSLSARILSLERDTGGPLFHTTQNDRWPHPMPACPSPRHYPLPSIHQHP